MRGFSAASWPFAAEPPRPGRRPHAVAHLKDLDGKPVGTADFPDGESRRPDRLRSHGLPPGPHGIHLHGSGNCDAKTGFTSAGPILTSVRWCKQHGYLAEGGPEAGDLPNQFAGADGRLHATVIASGFALGNGKRSIFDRDGVAIIVDQRGDDYRTQPLGNAGRAHRLRRGGEHRGSAAAPSPLTTAKAAH